MKKIVLFILVLSILSCNNTRNTEKQAISQEDPLALFNSSIAKTNIIEFVENVTNKKSADFIAPEDRIVCFDNDGTLWVEQPLPTQAYFAFDRIKMLSKNLQELAEKQPFKAIIENDMASIQKFTKKDLLQILLKANAIDNIEKFDAIVNSWIENSKDQKFNKPFDKLVYKPMLDLLNYLRDNNFKIFIVSGGSAEFMRAWAPRVYGVPKENIIGTRLQTEATKVKGQIKIKRLPILEFNDDKMGKVISIEKFIGKKPIMVVGNSDGDLEMMEYAANQKQKTLMVYLHHNDADREYFYDDKILAGSLVEGMKVAKEKGWTIIDMKADFKSIFPD